MMAAVNQGGMVLKRELKFASKDICRYKEIVMSTIKIIGGCSSYNRRILVEIGK